MVTALNYNRCIWEVSDPVTAGKQLHEILTKCIPMAKGSSVTLITGCKWLHSDWAGSHSQLEDKLQLSLWWLQVLAFLSIFQMLSSTQGDDESGAGLLPQGGGLCTSYTKAALRGRDHAWEGICWCQYYPLCNSVLRSSRLFSSKPYTLRPASVHRHQLTWTQGHVYLESNTNSLG